MRDYFRERMLTGKTLAAVMLLTAASVATFPALGLAAAAGIAGLTGLLFVQFRLWDDLSDLATDRVQHPRRVLCLAASLTPFRVAQIALLLLNVCLLGLWRPPSVLAFGLLNIFGLGWYGGTAGGLRRWVRSPLIRSHIVLLKYPMFVLLICGGHDVEGGVSPRLAMAFVFLCFSVFELLNDPIVREARGADVCLFVELAGLLGVSALVMGELR